MANLGNDRIVVLIDMDCFFCQVETKLQPEYVGKPLAVVQYNQWQLGGIIAVNYEARDYGVTRHMRGEEAKEKCPDIVLASVPCLRGKADTSRYRNAGREVVDVIKKHCNVIERASVDEAYLDITDIVDKRMSESFISREQLTTQLSNTFVVGYSEVGTNDEEERSKGTSTWINDIFKENGDTYAKRLAIAGVIVEELRKDIFNKTNFRCSAGIAQNKILAKLACGLHKPNRQTILPANAVSSLYSKLPIKKVRNLGGKFGDTVIESLNCNVMGDLLQYSLQYLQKRFDDKTGLWLYNIARGVDNEPVTMRLVSKSIGACKKFPGKQAITSLDVLKHWAGELAAEVCERLEQDLEENERRATLATICYHYYLNRTTISQSRSYTLNSYKAEKMADRCVEIITKSTQCPIAYLGISAGKFIRSKGSENFRNFFKSNKLEQCEETTTDKGNIKLGLDHIRNTVTETITNNLDSDKVTNISFNNDELKNVPIELDVSNQNLRLGAQLNEQIEPNISTDCSPTSRRLNSLINSLNERNRKKTFEDKESSSSLSNSLHQNDFKESFFMNVFNCKESKSNDARACNIDLIELTCDKSVHIEPGSPNENILTEAEDDNLNTTFRENVKECPGERIINDDIKVEPLLNIDDKYNANNSRNTIKLKDIFPDLNNIDPNVVALLPLELQAEAKMYMKEQGIKDNVKEKKDNITKTLKGKSKSKINNSKGKKSNDISSFLVKRNPTFNSIETPCKQCPHCYQNVPISKYQEHCDFHVAESLQRELNKSIVQSAHMKRKVDTDDASTNPLKRRPNGDILNINKNYKSITSFLL